jgi:DNA-binding IclR family transcriptional regulator
MSVSVKASEAACLEALRSGTERKVLIALRAGLNLPQTDMALGKLSTLGLATVNGRRTWHLTPQGKTADVMIAPAVRKRGRPPVTGLVPGTSAASLLASLDRPRHGAELPALLGVTRQRVHQLVVALSALDLVRSGDPNSVVFAIARKDDPSILLSLDQQRVLSAFPEAQATTLGKVAVAVRRSLCQVATIAETLRAAGLIQHAGTTTFGEQYRLTAAGAAHWQRSGTTRRAKVPVAPPPFRSTRVRDVLSHLANEGPTRTRDIGYRLGIPQISMNALMQYLKRKKAVRTQPRTDARYAPYELTPEGCEMLAAMTRPARDATAA